MKLIMYTFILIAGKGSTEISIIYPVWVDQDEDTVLPHSLQHGSTSLQSRFKIIVSHNLQWKRGTSVDLPQAKSASTTSIFMNRFEKSVW